MLLGILHRENFDIALIILVGVVVLDQDELGLDELSLHLLVLLFSINDGVDVVRILKIRFLPIILRKTSLLCLFVLILGLILIPKLLCKSYIDPCLHLLIVNHSIVVPLFVLAILSQRAFNEVHLKQLVDQAALSEKVYEFISLNENGPHAAVLKFQLRQINLFHQDFLSFF